jgi:hypothetical protein
LVKRLFLYTNGSKEGVFRTIRQVRSPERTRSLRASCRTEQPTIKVSCLAIAADQGDISWQKLSVFLAFLSRCGYTSTEFSEDVRKGRVN